MKVKVYVVDFEIPPRVKKWGLRIGIPAIVLSVAAVALAAAPLHTWSTGDTLQATDLNGNFALLQGQITTTSLGPRTPSAFQATLTSPTSVPAVSVVTIIFDSVAYDLASEYDATTGTFSPKKSGLYLVACGLDFVSNGAARWSAIIKDNGTEVNAFDSQSELSSDNVSAAAQGVIQLAAGDSLTSVTYHDGMGSQLLGQSGYADRTFFSATRLY